MSEAKIQDLKSKISNVLLNTEFDNILTVTILHSLVDNLHRIPILELEKLIDKYKL